MENDKELDVIARMLHRKIEDVKPIVCAMRQGMDIEFRPEQKMDYGYSLDNRTLYIGGTIDDLPIYDVFEPRWTHINGGDIIMMDEYSVKDDFCDGLFYQIRFDGIYELSFPAKYEGLETLLLDYLDEYDESEDPHCIREGVAPLPDLEDYGVDSYPCEWIAHLPMEFTINARVIYNREGEMDYKRTLEEYMKTHAEPWDDLQWVSTQGEMILSDSNGKFPHTESGAVKEVMPLKVTSTEPFELWSVASFIEDPWTDFTSEWGEQVDWVEEEYSEAVLWELHKR